jgi:WD40 repeat protein
MDRRIIVHDYVTGHQLADHMLEARPSGLDISHDGKELLVSLYGGQLLLLHTDTGRVLQRYVGVAQTEAVIRARFGGAHQGFVISGSEDSRVLIWRRHSGRVVAEMSAHGGGAVNAVAWHPTNMAMFATAGDDKRIEV